MVTIFGNYTILYSGRKNIFRGMLKLIFTLDYEIHGNGDGCPNKLMVKPTYRLMNLMDKYGAKLTIFADMAEISRFKSYYEENGADKFHYLKIKKQLQDAVIRGHDVQLHIHSSYFNARYDGKKWQQSWDEYDFARLEYSKIHHRIKTSKELLETIIQEEVPQYKCFAFRAANWAMQPTPNIARALLENDIYIDSSVYKYGKQHEWVKYDYTNAHHPTFPYKASLLEICENDENSPLWEFPIHCELRPFYDFITPIRLFRMIRAKFHKHKMPAGKNKSSSLMEKEGKDSPLSMFNRKFPRKFDFNQLNGKQLINQLKTIKTEPEMHGFVTLIGHSKSFVAYNEITLQKFLSFVKKNNDKYSFSLFPQINELSD